jgi:hypothetical protein
MIAQAQQIFAMLKQMDRVRDNSQLVAILRGEAGYGCQPGNELEMRHSASIPSRRERNRRSRHRQSHGPGCDNATVGL